MNALVRNQSWNLTGSEATTSGVETDEYPAMPPRLTLWIMGGTSAWSTLSSRLSDSCFWTSGTAFGWDRSVPVAPAIELLADIRRRARLTWDQLARMLGVQRRSLHLWARGARLSADNAERLEHVAAAIRLLDLGDPDQTRSALLRPWAGSESIYDLLCARRDREAVALARRGAVVDARPAATRKRPPALTRTARQARRGLPPTELVGGLTSAEPPAGRYIGASPIPRES